MKEKKIAIIMWAVMLSASIFADVYYNNKTFDVSETTEGKAYIGHANAADGGMASDALVTVKNGATWTAEDDIFLGNASGASRLFVENAGMLYVNDSKYLYVGVVGDVNAVVTNKGEVNAANIYLGYKDGGINTPRFDNFGTITIRNCLSIGEKSGSTLESVFYNHAGANLNITRTSYGQYAFYLGGRAPARIINEGTIILEKAPILRLGGVLTAAGVGTLVMSNNASFTSGSQVRIGGKGSKGSIILTGNSVFNGTANNTEVSIGYSGDTGAKGGEGVVSLSDSASLSCKTLYLGRDNPSVASVVLSDDSTLTFEGALNVAYADNSVATFTINNHSMTSFDKDTYVGVGASSVGTFRLDGTTALTMNGCLELGKGAGARGIVELDGTSHLTIPNSYLIGGSVVGGTGEVYVAGAAALSVRGSLSIGTGENLPGILTVSENGVVASTNVSVAAKKGGASQYGTLNIANNGVVTNVCEMCFGRGTTAIGYCNMSGGSIFLDSTEKAALTPLTIGVNATSTVGFLKGWGFVGFDDPCAIMINYADLGRDTWGGISIYGKVTADGGGVERNLDFSRAGVNRSSGSWAGNGCGTNGWYAMNKGRLVMPRSLPRIAKSHATIGDYPTLTNPRFVNSFRYDFDTDTMNTTGTYVFSELYAVDRSDIPAGLPSGRGIHHSAVWRIGHFNSTATPDVDDEDLTADHKQDFTSLKLKFHYDPALAEIEGVRHVKVYRCTDSVNGGWKCVASITAPDSDSPYIETVQMAPSSELWNCGWFAVVGTPKIGTVMVLR